MTPTLPADVRQMCDWLRGLVLWGERTGTEIPRAAAAAAMLERIALEAEELRAGLRFYADPANYRSSAVEDDDGDHARALLKENGNE